MTYADLFPQATEPTKKRISATYDYHDEGGAVLYQVVRYDQPEKDFQQRRPDGAGGWRWDVKGVRRVLCHLPELKGQRTVYVTEGERDADTLRALGIPATTNSGGAGKWRNEYTRQLVDAGVEKVVILPDNDEAGRLHAHAVARSCTAAGLAVKLVELPGLPAKGDVTDFLKTHSKADLAAAVTAAQTYAPAPTETTEEVEVDPPVDSAPYTFTDAFPADHFVTSYIEYAAQRTDAALEFHEGYALALLAAATPNIRAYLGPYDTFLDQTLEEVMTALESVYAGRDATEAVVRRAIVRRRIAEGVTEMLSLRQLLADRRGPQH